MLRQLYIENIAVIEKADISFADGFNVLSGETGAGKSIIIDSLVAIMGGRVSREIIRTGETRALVCASFGGISLQAMEYAARQGFAPQDSEVALKREIFVDGRNNCKINGLPATLTQLRGLGSLLLSIHGQHDGQHLLNEALHIDYLDSFGGLEDALEEYSGCYDALLQLNRKIKALSMSASEKERYRASLTARLAEVSAAEIKPGEQEDLDRLRCRLINIDSTVAALSEAASVLDGIDGEGGAIAALGEAEKHLKSAQKHSPEMEKLASRMVEANAVLAEVSAEVASALLSMDFSPQLLEDTEARLELIYRLCKKYSVEADGLEAFGQSLQAELDSIDDAEHNLEELSAEYAEMRARVSALADSLHAKREAAAQIMAGKIEAELHMLDMPSSRFHAEIVSTLGQSQAKFTRRGTDSVRFLLSTNSGEDLKPLSKVASGGELSRIMLAMKSVLSKGEDNITAIFDEIDAGVSGRAASHVGEKLYAISRARQVLCVTHLPQIASLADAQYRIEKNDDGDRTYTKVELLDRQGRIDELARLTAGVHVTQATLESAGQLLKMAEKHKTS